MKMNDIIAGISSAIRVVLKTSKSFLRFLWNLVCDSVRRSCFLFRTWRKSRKELATLGEKEQVAIGKAEKIEADTQRKMSAFAKDVASSRANAQAAQERLQRVSKEVQVFLKGFQQLVQEAASQKANPEISELRRQREQSEEEVAIVRRRCRDLMGLLEQRINKTETETLLPLEKDAKELLHLLVSWLKTPRMQQNKTIANVIDSWWKENYAGFLETADELNSRLSQLPDELDAYTIQFKGDQVRLWLQPDGWTFDDNNNLILSRYNNGGEPFTVEGLRSLLGGDTTDSYGNAVNGDMEVFLQLKNNVKRYRPLDISFSISHDKELVVIMMDDDGTFDGYDEDYGNANDDSEEEDSTDTEYGDAGEEDDARDSDGNNEYNDFNDNDGEDNDDNEEANDSCDNDDDDGPEHDYDPSRSGSDLDQSFLETANDLFERLDELPKKCNGFLVRFTAANSDNWIQPEEWHIDDDGDLIFGCIDDGENHDDEQLTVADLKDILTGGRDDGDIGVEEDTSIYVDDPDSDTYFRPLDEYFKIHWKEGLVYIPMIEGCGNDDEDDDEQEDEDGEEDDFDNGGEDEEDENEEWGDDDSNDDDEKNEEYNGGDEGDDEDNEDEEREDDEGEDDGDGDDFARQAASGLTLGLILESERRRRKS